MSYDSENNVMFCTKCREHKTFGIRGKNAFITGSDTSRPDSLRAHDVSEAHNKATGNQIASKAEPGTAQAHRAIQGRI